LIKRGEVYWVAFDPTVGSEIRKTRPAVVVSNDANNLHANTVTVLPMTTAVAKVRPFEVLLESGICGNREAGKVKADQIRTLDKRRFGNLMGFVPSFLMTEIDTAMRLHLALD
jgi:mRNA interferase MazF